MNTCRDKRAREIKRERERKSERERERKNSLASSLTSADTHLLRVNVRVGEDHTQRETLKQRHTHAGRKGESARTRN